MDYCTCYSAMVTGKCGCDGSGFGGKIPKITICTEMPNPKTEKIIECRFCKLLEELFNSTPKSGKDYYTMTELFILYHKGDRCKDEI